MGVSLLVLSFGIVAASPALAAARPNSKPTVSIARADAMREARQFLSHIKVGAPLHSTGTFHASTTNGVSQLTSTNWSGYADVGAAKSFTTVSGSWKEPTAICGSGLSLAAFWVGIDGISSSDPTVEQDGTIIECDGGSASYFDWWEMYPTNAVQIKNAVNPGDQISAKVSYNGSYSLSVTDSTHSGDSFSVTESCGSTTCENESAEWIAEAPCCQSSGNVYNLSDFTKWKVTSAATTYNGTLGPITEAPTIDEITMVDSSNRQMSVPGALNAGGNGFKVKWKATD
jgi:hypothetical protein